MYKFLHAADVHLDSPLLNLDQYEGAPVEAFRSAPRRAFDNLVELAITERVRFVLIAGDLYDGDCRDFNTPRHFGRQMERLGEHDIRVFVIQGNHDAESKMRKAFRLQLPDNVHLFKTNKAETVRIDDVQVAIHGQGFAQKAIEHDLSGAYPEPERGWLNIGMLHTSCGAYEGHDRYAPSTVAGLTSKGYQYWALGHIHKRENLAGPDPWIVYPGNVQGRHIREPGAKGCVIATVDDDRVTTTFHAIDVLRWEVCSIDATECDDAASIVDRAETSIGTLLDQADGRPLAVRVEVTGETNAHRELARHPDHWDRRIRDTMVDTFDEHVWVEKIKFRTRPRVALNVESSAFGELLSGVRDLDSASTALAEVRDDFEKLRKLLPTDPRLPEQSVDLDDEAAVAALLDDAKELLVSRLAEGADA